MAMAMATAMATASKRPRTERLMQRLALKGKGGRLALIGVTAALVAYAAGRDALSQVVRVANPDMARRVAPYDGRAAANAADRLVIQSEGKPDLARLESLARTSLIHEPINPVALRILGLVADVKGQAQEADRFITLSSDVSRRDVGTQLWLIERGTRRADLTDTLTHYDAALQTSPEAGVLLIPILSQAIDDPEIRKALAPFMKEGAPWWQSLFNYTIDNSKTPRSLALLAIAGGGLPKTSQYKEVEARLLSALVAKGDMVMARQYYLSLPGSDASLLSNYGFSDATVDARFRPLTWEPLISASSGVMFDQERNGARAFAGPGERGTVLRRALFLAPGKHMVTIDEQIASADQGVEHSWRIHCVGQKPNEATWFVRLIGNQAGVKRAPLNVPQGCSSQLIELEAVGGLGQTGLELVVRKVSFLPVPNTGSPEAHATGQR